MTERLSRQRLEELRHQTAAWDEEAHVYRYTVMMTMKEIRALLDAAERDLEAHEAQDSTPGEPDWPTVAATLRELIMCCNGDGVVADSLLDIRAREIEGGGK